jgi:hypothetical protein
MTLHLIKWAAGIESVPHLRAVHARRRQTSGSVFSITGITPRRAADLVAGGSLYWVIRHVTAVRQPLLAIGTEDDPDRPGRTVCRLTLGDHVAVAGHHRRPFQGWRYLTPEDAPADLPAGIDDHEPPPEMAAELRALGLL